MSLIGRARGARAGGTSANAALLLGGAAGAGAPRVTTVVETAGGAPGRDRAEISAAARLLAERAQLTLMRDPQTGDVYVVGYLADPADLAEAAEASFVYTADGVRIHAWAGERGWAAPAGADRFVRSGLPA